ncbi:MAG: phosphorylase [Methylococcales bacterium]
MITGIVVALPEELSTITTKKIAKGSCVFINANTVVTYCGAGYHNAQRGAQQLLSEGATRLISWGCAAALSENLKPGDLILADSLLTAEHQVLGINAQWHGFTKNLLSAVLTIKTGLLAESVSLVSSSQAKQQIHVQTRALALDMESAAIARVAAQQGLPFLVLRAIADPVSMNLPQAVSHALNADGDVVLSKLLLFLAGHPNELPGLIKLGWHFHAATKTLKLIAKQLHDIVNFNVITHFA